MAIAYLIISSSGDDKKVITGLVEITDVDVASKIPGRIDSIFVNEGDFVKKGQILAKLQSKEIDAKVEQTKGQLEAAKFKYQMALNGARPEEKDAVEKLYLQAKHQFDLAEKPGTECTKCIRIVLYHLRKKMFMNFNTKLLWNRCSLQNLNMI